MDSRIITMSMNFPLHSCMLHLLCFRMFRFTPYLYPFNACETLGSVSCQATFNVLEWWKRTDISVRRRYESWTLSHSQARGYEGNFWRG